MSLKKNTIANYLGQFYSIFIGIFILPFYLQYLGAEAYGLVGFFTMLMSWMMLLDMGLSQTISRQSSILRETISGRLELKKLLRSIELIFLFIILIFIFFIFSSSQWLATHWLEVQTLSLVTVEKCIKLMAFMIAFRWFVGLYQGSLIGFEEHIWLNVFKVFINTLKFFGAFILIKYFSADIYHFFIYQLVVGILEFCIIVYKQNSFFNGINHVNPSFFAIKKVLPFALGIAYTSGIWVFITQLDKLMLSHYLPLKEYGYFTLVTVASNGILQFFQPISQTVLPRMTSMFASNKKDEMITLYHHATQMVSIVMFSVAGTIATFSYELLFSWTGNHEAATWGAPILFWFALGNIAVSLLSFQFYIQYAHGNLKYHITGNTYFGAFQIIIIVLSIHFYGAMGAAFAWFFLQTFFLLVWPAYIHSKFVPGLHKRWIFKDILPFMCLSLVILLVCKNIELARLSRFYIMCSLLGLGSVILLSNIFASTYYRNYMINFFRSFFGKV